MKPAFRRQLAAFASIALAIALQAWLTSAALYTSVWGSPLASWQPFSTAIAAALFGALLVTATQWQAPERSEVANALPWMAAVLCVAIAMRTWRIDEMPPGFFQDEAINGNDALWLGRARGWELWSLSVSGRPTAFLYLLLGAIQIFGRSYLALKVVPIAVGTAAVVAVYFLGKAVHDRRTGLFAAFFLAVGLWPVHYSRMAWEASFMPLLTASALFFWLRAEDDQRDSWKFLAACGAVLGIGLYTYAAFRSVIAAASICWAASILWPPPTIARRWLLVTPIAALLIAAPLLLFAYGNPELVFVRSEEVGLWNLPQQEFFDALLDQVGKTILAFHHVGDSLVRHNLPRAPQLDPVTGTAALLGITCALRDLTPRRRYPLIVWLLTTTFLPCVTSEAPHATRLLPSAPLFALCAGLGAQRALATLRQGMLQRTIVAATLTAALALNAYNYFVLHSAHPATAQGFNRMARDLCEDLRKQPGIFVYWTDDVAYWASPQCQFLAPEANIAHEVIPLDMVLSGFLDTAPRPAILLLGETTVRNSRDRVRIGPDELPDLPMPMKPTVYKNAAGVPHYYRYELP